MDCLSNDSLKLIMNNGELSNEHIDAFLKLIPIFFPDYVIVKTCQIQTSDYCEISADKKHIQLIFNPSKTIDGVGNWICCYYDAKDLYVFDSLNSNILSDYQKKVLQILHPYIFSESSRHILFPKMEKLVNKFDDGL